MNHPRISIGRKIERLPVDEKSLLQLREQDKAPDWRLGRCGQKAVVAARVPTDDGGGGKASDPIGLQPLPMESSIEVTARCFLELNHEFLLCNFAEDLDSSVWRCQLVEQLSVIVEPIHWIRQKLAQPSRILCLRLSHVTHAHFEIFPIGVHSSDHNLVAEDKFEVDPVSRNFDHLVAACDTCEHQHSVLAERLHAVENYSGIACPLENEIERAEFSGRIDDRCVGGRHISCPEFFDQV